MFSLDIDGAIARLTLDRPEARNAIPAAAWPELTERLAEVARSEARLLILCGAGDAFCAGADLGDFEAMRGDAAIRLDFRAAMRTALDALRDLAFPSVAWIDGACYGAGVALAIACDLRVAGREARLAVPPAKIGLSYPQEDVHRLVALVGPGQAARLLFTAAVIDGAEAAAIGLAEYYAPEGDLEPVLEAICANEPASLAALKRGIRLAAEACRSDAEQDRTFDALIGGEALARRLEALRRK